ncbi:MAG: hypothetical protein ABIG11_08710 [bacterium]
MRFFLLFFAAFAFTCVFPLLTRADAGTSAANFLKIPIAPIPTAMGQAYTAMVGPDSILYNPAGLGLMNYSAFSGTHHEYIDGIRQEYAALAWRSRAGTVGIAFSMLNSGSIDAYDTNDAHIGQFSTSHELGVISFSRSFPQFDQDLGMQDAMLIHPNWSKIETVKNYRPRSFRLSLGGSLKHISERLDDTTSRTFSADAGVLLVFPRHFQVGASLLNMGGRQKFYLDTASLPMTARLGMAKDFNSLENILIFTLTADAVKEFDYESHLASGLEMDIMQMIQLRAGYRTNRDTGTGLSAGMGLTLDRFTDKENFIHGVRLDYAFLDYGAFGSTHRFGFQLLW